MGFPSNGAFNSHQMVISMAYRMGRYNFISADFNTICETWRQIDETGLYDPGHGFELWKPGKSVISDDGKARYESAVHHHPRDIDVVHRGGAFSLTVGNALTYGGSASVFGVGIKAETSHSTMVAQVYKAGPSLKIKHFVWGNNGNLADNPQVEYSY